MWSARWPHAPGGPRVRGRRQRSRGGRTSSSLRRTAQALLRGRRPARRASGNVSLMAGTSLMQWFLCGPTGAEIPPKRPISAQSEFLYQIHPSATVRYNGDRGRHSLSPPWGIRRRMRGGAVGAKGRNAAARGQRGAAATDMPEVISATFTGLSVVDGRPVLLPIGLRGKDEQLWQENATSATRPSWHSRRTR